MKKKKYNKLLINKYKKYFFDNYINLIKIKKVLF